MKRFFQMNSKKALLLVAVGLASSCQGSGDLKVGQCVQKPDSAIVYKIAEKTEEHSTLVQDVNPDLEREKVVANLDGYIETACP